MVLAETGRSRTGLLPMITKQQYRKLMSEYQQTGNVTVSAMKADVSRPTARKYLEALQPPNELQAKHSWRTREDPLEEIWPQAVRMLEEAADLEAKALFEHLWERSPWAVQEQHLRTFQRRVKLWRLQYGPDQEVFFPQDWEAGRAMQLDWTNANELAIRLAGSLTSTCSVTACCRIPTGNGPRAASPSRCCRCARVCRKPCIGWARHRGSCG